MDRIVIWGFALALIPLTLAAGWELIVLFRTTVSGRPPTERSTATASQRETP